MSMDLSPEEAVIFGKKIELWMGRFGQLFMLIGLICLISALNSYFFATASQDWRKIKGTIITNDLDKRRTSGANQSTVIIYKPIIKYKYEFNDQEYIGERIRFSALGGTSSKESINLINKYRLGQEVDVYLDDKEPSKSVLEPGINSKNKVSFAPVFIFSFIGYMIYRSRRIYGDPQQFIGESYK